MTISATTEEELLPWGDPAFRENPYPWYTRLRRDHPVYQLRDGTYIVSRYQDITQWAKHPCMSIIEPDLGAWGALANTMLFKDPPEHATLRRHTNRWFTPKLMKQWVTETAQVAAEGLDRMGPDRTIEAHYELGVRPMHITMCRVMQVSEDDVKPVPEAMITAMDAIVAQPEPEHHAHAKDAFAYLIGRMERMLEEKRTTPGDGMADALLAAHDQGEMTYRQVVETLTLFWASSGHNPGFLVPAGLELFARRPELFTTYREDPTSRQPIVEELIRMEPAEISYVRYPLEDVQIGGVTIPAGSRVRFMTAAANRDPEVFDRPDEFDYTRPPGASRHLSFGIGPHSCPGQLFTRAGVETIFTTVAERYRRIELTEEPTTYHTDRGRNYRKLPIRLT